MKKLVIILVFTLACIEAFTQKPLSFKRRSVTLNPNSGYVNIEELHYGYGLGTSISPYGNKYFGLTTMHGYQLNIYGLHINSSFIAGVGTGVLLYDGGLLIPLSRLQIIMGPVSIGCLIQPFFAICFREKE